MDGRRITVPLQPWHVSYRFTTTSRKVNLGLAAPHTGGSCTSPNQVNHPISYSIRTKELASWFKQVMPDQQNTDVFKDGASTWH